MLLVWACSWGKGSGRPLLALGWPGWVRAKCRMRLGGGRVWQQPDPSSLRCWLLMCLKGLGLSRHAGPPGPEAPLLTLPFPGEVHPVFPSQGTVSPGCQSWGSEGGSRRWG